MSLNLSLRFSVGPSRSSIQIWSGTPPPDPPPNATAVRIFGMLHIYEMCPMSYATTAESCNESTALLKMETKTHPTETLPSWVERPVYPWW